MDPTLLRYYERELQHLREMGGEFAREFPKIAGRLGLEGFECADPYVERLLEGFGFLAARVQLRLDAEFPRFTQHLLELVYPHYLAPTPSMAVVQLQPDLAEGSLAEGFTVPRGAMLRSQPGRGEGGVCEYRTAHDTTLWPIELVQARYFRYGGELGGVALPRLSAARAGVRLRLRSTAGLLFNQIALDRLALHLRGSDALPVQLYELLLAHAVGVVAHPASGPAAWHVAVPAERALRRVGFADDEALLPYGPRSFQGYRLLQEYFAFPQRFLFVELAGLQPALARCSGDELDVIVLLDRSDPALERLIDAANFALFCTPAVNLFARRADRIHLTHEQSEYHVLPDRTRPLDLEVYQVTRVTGYGSGADSEREFRPFYAARDGEADGDAAAYYQLRRVRRALAERERRYGARSSYVGSEVYIGLVDEREAPFSTDLRQLGIELLCTNRDLPLMMPVGVGATDFTLESGAPVAAIRCVAGPSRPLPPRAEGETAWRLISHLSLNYLSLLDQDPAQGALALRELLRLYCDKEDAAALRQIEGLRSVASKTVTRRLPGAGPIAFGRGLAITILLDEAAFEGSGAFVLGAVLEQFFARYATLNSFTETAVKTLARGEIVRWPARIGQCSLL
ncbi:MAG TPA: type VI secretion system baseplate subunit TssF [Burkholderiaceae bacterium]|nr:type VI secretion system baseplate subunit TssF [Burkholderiaceae bacterium]